MSRAKNILIIRNDKLGDFMLAWPALSLLKRQYPDCTISVLVPPYTEPMAKLCPWIDEVLLDETRSSLLSDSIKLTNKIKQQHFDVSISLFTETRTALATFLSHIPCRIAPATKIAQIFSNKRVKQRRSKSDRPEHEYNTDLVNFYIKSQGDTLVQQQPPPYLVFDAATTVSLREKYIAENDIDTKATLIIVHPGTGGSAINFSVEQYAGLLKQIAEHTRVHLVITAGPGEEKTAQSLSILIQGIHHNIYLSTKGLEAFSRFITICDLFISGSTGTLHIAGALDVPTAAFYPARKSATSLRWQTLNQDNNRITFSPEKHTGENDMATIDPVKSGQEIVAFIKRLKIQR